jgi:hypothetical protein
MPIPYASAGIPITGGMQMPADDGMGTTSEGRARAEAFRRLMAKAPGTDYQSAMQQLPGQMQEEAGARAAAGPTVLQPSRTTAFSGRDAQALQTLDPRALEEARGLAALDQPKKMTGSFGGQSFEMTPAARVDRNALAGIYNKFQTKQGQERQDSVRAQEQGGKERIVSIPGEQATKRREMELGTEERLAGKKFEADAPERAARIASSQAQTAAVTGAEGRAQAQAARQPSPQLEAVERSLAESKASPFAQTPDGRARIMAMERIAAQMRGMSPESAEAVATGSAGPAADPVSVLESDENVQKIIADAASKKGAWSLNPFSGFNSEGRRSGMAARKLAESSIRRAAQKYGMSPEEVQQYIQSKLGD